MWRSEDNSGKLVLSSHLVGLGHQTHMIRLGGTRSGLVLTLKT